MSAHVLLNLLNELGQRDKMRGLLLRTSVHDVIKICKPLVVYGSIPLNIHEARLHPLWGEAYRRKKIPVDHFIGHILLLYKKLIKGQIY